MSAGPLDESFLWKADSSLVSIHPFEDVFVAFNALSGDTHILNFLSVSVLSVLFDDTLGKAELILKVRQDLELDEADCPDTLIHSTLSELDETGLVKPVIREK